MNKMLLKILVILGLIAPVCTVAMRKRVDSPGVAQHKLDMVIKGVKGMTEDEKKQAFADLSPALRADYEDALNNMPVKDRKNFEAAFLIMKRKIKDGELNNEKEVLDFANILKVELELNDSETLDLKILGKRRLEHKSEDRDKGRTANEKLFQTLDNLEKDEKNLASFLQKLKEYFDKNLNDKEAPYKVNTTKNYFIENSFDSGMDEYKTLDSYVNNFFTHLSQYAPKTFNPFVTSDNFSVIQDAFIKCFFPLVNDLALKLKNSSDEAALTNANDILTKGNDILEFKWDKNYTIKTRVFKEKSIYAESFDYGQSYLAIVKQYLKIVAKGLGNQPENEQLDLMKLPKEKNDVTEGKLIDLDFN